MDMKHLRKQCEVRLQTLSIPHPFDLDVFVAGVAARRSRPLMRHAVPLRGEVFGFWAEMPDEDLIVYEERTAPFHQRHIILHEVSHILCGHRGVPLPHATPVGDLTLAEFRARYRCRQQYTSEEECEAEVLATLIDERAYRLQAGTAGGGPHSLHALRLLDSLEGMSHE